MVLTFVFACRYQDSMKKKNFGHNAIGENEVVWELKIEGERERRAHHFQLPLELSIR